MSDKTEQASARRLRKAREEGDSGASAYAAQTVSFVVAVALVPYAVGALVSRASADLRGALALVAGSGPPYRAGRFDPTDLGSTVLSLAMPILLAAGLAGAVAQAVQTGGVVATRRLSPDPSRLDPVAGLRGLFSATRLFAALRALVAGAAVAWLALVGVRDHLVEFARLAGRPAWISVVVRDVASALTWRAVLVAVVLGAADMVITRRTWLRKLRMSKDEVRREHRETEGDPLVKAARERAHHELMTQATLASVRNASVVVVNPTHLACALRYDERRGDDAPADDAPVVVASGRGDLAARIVEAARHGGVPVVRDVPLAHALGELEVGQVIPEALYEAVAEILRAARDAAGGAAAPVSP